MECSDQPGLMPLAQAMEQMLSALEPVKGVEEISLDQSRGRVLAEAVVSPLAVPPCDNSGMDGYAMRREDVQPGQSLTLVGQSFAGAPFDDTVQPGQCIRIMTGARIPDGADCVIMQEQAHAEGNRIRFDVQPQPGQHIRRRGEDITDGEVLFTAGHRLKPADIGLLASLGIGKLAVLRRVRVALLATGDELRDAGEALGSGDIYESNRASLKPLLDRLPVEVIDLGIIADDKAQLREAFHRADAQADLVLTSGGVSVGEADYTKAILDELGEVGFWKLAIKPGKPLAFGRLPNSHFLGLPGNPVSALVTFHQVGTRAVEKLAGTTPRQPLRLPAVAGEDLRKRPGRMDFQRGICDQDSQGQLVVRSTGAQGSGILSSVGKANCYIVLERERGDVSAGETVTVEPFDALLD